MNQGHDAPMSYCTVVTKTHAYYVGDTIGWNVKTGQFRHITNAELYEIDDAAIRLKLYTIKKLADEVVYQNGMVTGLRHMQQELRRVAFWRGMTVGVVVGGFVILAISMVSKHNDRVRADERQKVTAIEEASRAAIEASDTAAERSRFVYVGRGAYISNDSGVHRRSDGAADTPQDRASGVRRTAGSGPGEAAGGRAEGSASVD